jgi:hypothetical protein
MFRMSAIRTKFLSKISKSDETGCWEWTAGKTGKGYGAFSINGKNRPAHRVSYELFKEPIPDGLFICHRCDNPGCVNPGHLFLGTHQDNMDDRSAKGRTPPLPNTHSNQEWNLKRILSMPKGSDNHATRYSDEKVLQIHELRKTGIGPKPISEALGIPEMFVQDVIYGRARRYLHPDEAIRNRLTRERTPRQKGVRKKYSDETVEEVRRRIAAGDKGCNIARELDVPRSLVYDLKLGRTRG